MSSPKPEQFAGFYKAANGKSDDPKYGPFPWQSCLAKRVCAGDWPRAIALPTAAGKTACIDVAVFALACGAKELWQPRRIFFVVDRRVVVDQAFEHAKKLAVVLDRATEGVLREAADALRNIAEPGWLELPSDDRLRILRKRWALKDAKTEAERQKIVRELKDDEREWIDIGPLDVYALRGGMYRESAWARSPLQPTVIASTVDQVGSRLLFRGYGVSDSMKPVHAGLVGNDALILLDEAHCAKPFDQTVQAVESYRTWGETNPAPFRFVSLTATPRADVPREEANADDLSHPVLGKRINASKPAALVVAEKAKGKDWNKWGPPLVEVLAARARELMGQDLGRDEDGKQHAVRAVGVIVNRVATARRLAEVLRTPPGKTAAAEPQPEVILLTGRMRPLDRDQILKRLEPLFSGKGGEIPPTYVVATQCLEVGADLDFHALVTECASLDALRQRFGRLNRVAARPAAKAAVVIRADQTEPEEKEENADPVYGNALANTWQWLRGDSATPRTEFDFGVSAVRAATEGVDLTPLNAPSPDAPVLFPAHLDCWVQTHPIPTPDPDLALFLHGPKETRQPDVQVVFRADLGDNPAQWAEIVSLCPPSSSEAVAVPIGVFKKWLAGELAADDTADVEGAAPDEPEDEEEPQSRHALRWRGPEEGEEKSNVISVPNDVTPNDTYVVRVPPAADDPERNALRRLADLDDELRDYGDPAFMRSRDKAVLRFTPAAVAAWPQPFQTDRAKELAALSDEVEDVGEFAETLDRALDELAAVEVTAADLRPWEWLCEAAAALARPKGERGRAAVAHRDCERYPRPVAGVVVTGRDRLRQFDPTYLDDTEPGESFRGRHKGGRAVTLEEHSAGVADYAKRFADGCGLDAALYEQAGVWHDLGKLDPRFQAMLKQSSPRTAVGAPLAKSGRMPRPKEAEHAREVHKYPKGGRHELLSAALVATRTDDDLLLHLVATHHGSGRPFADAVQENDAARAPFEAPLFKERFKLDTAAQQIHEWNAELPERFWRVVRKYGWWGAAYREAVFRLADHAQSAAEQEQAAPEQLADVSPPPLRPTAEPSSLYPLPLPGLDGSNPLAFLAALGALRLADRAFPGTRLSWELRGAWTAVLHIAEKKAPEELVAVLLANAGGGRRCLSFAEDLKIPADQFRNFQEEARVGAHEDREFADFLCAYADPLVTIQGGPNAGKSKPTELYFIAGNQKFLKQTQKIAATAKEWHLLKCLFSQWCYDDPLEGLSLRWDPMDDFRYATRFHNPSADKSKGKRGSVLGANRLAFEALPLFPSFTNGVRLATTGFVTLDRRPFFTWPIWTPAWGVDAVRSALSLLGRPRSFTKNQQITPREQLGVVAWYQCEKVANSDYSNFAPACVL